MKTITTLVLTTLMAVSVSFADMSTSTPGSIVVVQNYRGAPFTWERWLKPVIYISVQAGKTVACVFNPNYSEVDTCK